MSNSASVPGEIVPGSGTPGFPGTSAPPPGWPPFYTVNFCPNPSLETDASGYTPAAGGEVLTRQLTAFSGKYGLMVTTPGRVPGEGVATPAGTVTAAARGAMSIYLYGDAGLLTVSAMGPGGAVLGSVPVQPDPTGWQRVEVDQLSMIAGQDVYLLVTTTTAQALTFVVDAVQYEPTSPAHAYTDGDQAFGVWGTPPGTPDSGRLTAAVDRVTAPTSGVSYQAYQFQTSAAGGMNLEGAIEVTVIGAVFQVGPVSGQMDMSGLEFDMTAVTATGRTVIPPAIDTGVPGFPWVISGGGDITEVSVVIPGSGFAEFAVYSSADPDPAMTLIGASNAGTENGNGSYTRIYGTFSPPRQRLDSGGNALWQAAAYMAVGYKVASQGKWSSGTPNGVNFTQVQVEKATGDTPGDYLRARALSTIVKPTELNYVTNPSLEAGTTGWSAVSGATVTQLPGGFQGSYCLQVSVPSAGGGASIDVPSLIFGDAFSASAYVMPVSDNIVDISLAAGAVTALANPAGYPFGAGDYGDGPYGGINTSVQPMVTGTWYRPWTAFTALASTVTLAFTAIAVDDAVYPLVFNIDCVMVSPGETLTAYGDGSSDEWQWEVGGTPGLARSYFYERERVGANAVQSVLSQHVPLGLTAYAPQFAVSPPTQ